MEFTFDVGQTPIIGRRYLKGGPGQVSLPGQASGGSSTVSSTTSESLREKEQVSGKHVTLAIVMPITKYFIMHHGSFAWCHPVK